MKFDSSKHWGFDLETTGKEEAYGLQPWRVAQGEAFIRVASVAKYVGDKMTVDGELDPSTGYLRWVLETAATEGITLVGWNVAFDCAWLCAVGLEDQVRKCRWLDAMLLWMHREREPEYDAKSRASKRPWTLEYAIQQYYPKSADFKQIKDFHTTDPVLLKRLLLRNKMDAVTTLRLAQDFWNDLSDKQQRCAVIEAASITPVAKANLFGQCVDHDRISALTTKLEVIASERLATLSQYGATPEVLASPQQLGTLLYDQWGLPIRKLTKTRQPSTDKETLFELAPSDERVQLVKDYREANNNRTKFVANIDKSAEYNGDDRTHPSASIFGTYTGRMTYSSNQGRGVHQVQTGFALHQMKRDKEFRALITPPPGYVLAEFDAANQEYRLMAVQSGDPVMLQMCQPGEDGHGYMGAQIGRVAYEELLAAVHDEDCPDHKRAKQLRQFGKVANLSFSYRVGVEKATVTARVQHGLDVDEPFVGKMKRVYLRSYKEVEKYWDRAIAKARRQGYAESLAGRRVQLKGNWTGKNSWSLESTAINYPIQASGADQKYLAIAMLKPVMVKRGVIFAWELHDGLYFYIPQEQWEATAAEMFDVLQRLPYKRAWDFETPIPLPFDCKVGESWGAMREWKPS